MINEFSLHIEKISEKKLTNEFINGQVIIIDQLLNNKKEKEKEKILKIAITTLMESIQNRNYKKAFGYARFIFLCNFRDPIVSIKKIGAFRASKYGYKTNLLKNVIFEVYRSKGFKAEDMRYIQSILALLTLSTDILQLKIKIQSFIKSRPSFLKNALAIAEIKYHDINSSTSLESTNLKDSLYYDSSETFISSVSYTLQLFKEIKYDITGLDSIYVEQCSMDDAYLKIFYDAYLIQIFNDSEINVDFFDYDADISKNNKMVIYNHNFEYALRQGYTKSDLRWMAINTTLSQDSNFGKSPRFSEMMDYICKDGFAEKHMYTIKKEPIERITLNVIYNPIDENKDLFSTSNLYFEELSMLWTLSLENYNADFINLKIFKDFTALDIIKIQRFFGYVSYVYNYAHKQLIKSENKNSNLIRKRSLLPVMKTEELAKVIHTACGHSIEDCLIFISKISIDFSNKDQTIDLQYFPVIKMGSASLILPTVLSHSNLIRSFSLNENIHLSTFEHKDHMVELIKDTLQKSAFHVKSDFKYGKDEIDILAFKNDSLFIFECKNPYHPVNSFELRNTYSHILKGFNQIHKIKEILSKKESLKQLLLNAGVTPSQVKNIHYGVINANRTLYGLTKDDVKVYHANELINFISTGEILSLSEKYQAWETDSITSNDLFRFLNGDVITSDFEEIRSNLFYEYPLRSHSIVLLTNAFELHKLPEILNRKYKKRAKYAF